jgi:hypothetical protein
MPSQGKVLESFDPSMAEGCFVRVQQLQKVVLRLKAGKELLEYEELRGAYYNGSIAAAFLHNSHGSPFSRTNDL